MSDDVANKQEQPADLSTVINLPDNELGLLRKIAVENDQIHAELHQVQEVLLQLQQQLYKLDIAVKATKLRWAIDILISLLFLKPKIGKLHLYPPRPFTQHPKRYKKIDTLENYPTISIVTPSYNQGAFLERTLTSVISQNYPALEYIIQDGGSTDNTVQILETYKQALKHCESIKDKGQSHALNLGFRHATGDIMAYLNSDDILMGGALHYVAKYFNDHPEVDVVYSHRVIINEFDQEVGRWILPAHDNHALTWASFVPQETLFWRRSIWEKIGGQIDESFHFAMDWDLLLRFKEANAKFVRLPRFLGAFRVHSAQKTSMEINDKGSKEMARLRFRCHGMHITQSEIYRNFRSYQIKHAIYQRLYNAKILRY